MDSTEGLLAISLDLASLIFHTTTTWSRFWKLVLEILGQWLVDETDVNVISALLVEPKTLILVQEALQKAKGRRI